MARKSRTRKKAKGAKAAQPQKADAPQDVVKRTSLSTIGLYAAGALVVGGGGTAFAYDFMRHLGEQDLSKIGNGTPAIVQIHDPQCSMCRALQSETRAALKQFDRGDITYLVANIRSTDGAAFASGMGLGHVTLVLFDGAGNAVHTVQGVTPAEALEMDFRTYLKVGSGA